MSQRGPHGGGIVLAAGPFGTVLVRTRGFAVVVLVLGGIAVPFPVRMRYRVLVLVRWRPSRVLVLMLVHRGSWHSQCTHDLPKEHIEEDHQ